MDARQIANPGTPASYREESVDPSLKKHMPRFEKQLAAEDIELIARWTRARARGLPPLR